MYHWEEEEEEILFCGRMKAYIMKYDLKL